MKTATLNHWERKLQQAVSLSHDDPYGEMNLKTIAEMLNESLHNFSHKFVEFYGEPYMQFVKRRRLEAGAGLLRHSDFSIGLISDMCGYMPSAFSKAFRALYHEAPVSFRNRIYLPNEMYTLQRAKVASTPDDDPESLIFSADRTESVTLPDSILYYNILPRNNDPIRSMVTYMTMYQQQLYAIKSSLQLPGAMIITGTLDVVPVTTYNKMMMYVGILVPRMKAYDMAHLQISLHFQEPFNLFTKRLPGGPYKKLPVPMDFASAGVPMYEFINRSCRAGYFKMSGNHFFISLTGDRNSEIFIPWQRR
ncbi:AraC family transcriptional regulator [Chitinophaga sp. 212800010-3]|uniref:AraC family transcriptional regulator n=1 Tax=unclassified Chitinophaga TaxID=2619133 RepID=UPI002DED8E71|nr:AraC-type DNA-binding protein [Chitinophaga sp. 212800010-3]